MIRDRVVSLLRPTLGPFLARRERVRLHQVPAIQADVSALGQTDVQTLAAMFVTAQNDPEREILARRVR